MRLGSLVVMSKWARGKLCKLTLVGSANRQLTYRNIVSNGRLVILNCRL